MAHLNRSRVCLAAGALLLAAVAQAEMGPPVKIQLVEFAGPTALLEPSVLTLRVLTGRELPLEECRVEGTAWTTRRIAVEETAPPAGVPEGVRAYDVVCEGDAAAPGAAVEVIAVLPDIRFRQILTLPEEGVAAARTARCASMPAPDIGAPSPSTEKAVRTAPLPSADPVGAQDVCTHARGTKDARKITVTGHYLYVRRDGTHMPVDGATVRVYDSDVTFDTRLATGITDSTGRFSLTFTWDPCFVCDQQPDIYVEIEAANSAITVQSAGVEANYKYTLPKHNDFTGTSLAYGSWQPTANHQALHILTTLTRAWRWLRDHEGYDTPGTDVQWPDGESGAYYNSVFNEIHISSEREWDETTAVHEYGHRWIDVFSDDENPSYCNGICDEVKEWWFDDCGHCMWCRENNNVAWSEGFPDWLADVITRSFEPTYGASQKPLHTESLELRETCEKDGALHDSRLTEGHFAALLRDIEDGANEADPASPGFHDCLAGLTHEIFTVAYADKPLTPGKFLTDFAARYPLYHELLVQTAANNGFTLAPPVVNWRETFSDNFSRADGAPAGWRVWSGDWRIESQAMTTDTRPRRLPAMSSPPVGLARTANTLDVFSVNREGHLLQYGWQEGTDWTGDDMHAAYGIDPAVRVGVPYLLWPGGQTFDLFGYYSGTCALHHLGWAPGMGWQAESVPLARCIHVPSLAGVRDPTGALDVFGIADSRLRHVARSPAGVWTNANLDPSTGMLPTYTLPPEPPGVVALDDGVYVFAAASEERLVQWYRARGAATWQITSLNETNPDLPRPAVGRRVAALAVDETTVHVFALGAANVDPFYGYELIHYWKAPGEAWRAENASQPILQAAPLASELRFKENPVVLCRATGSFDVFSKNSGSGLVHYHYEAGTGWTGVNVNRVSGTNVGVIAGDLCAVSLGDDRLDVVGVASGGYLLHYTWDPEHEWHASRPTADPSIGGQYRLINNAISAVTRGGGVLDVFGLGDGLGEAPDSLIHYAWSSAAGWTAENVTGFRGGAEAYVWAGASQDSFRNVAAVSFSPRFLVRPADGVGRHAGAMLFAPSILPRWQSSGYTVDWIDRTADRGYRISRWDCGTETPLVAGTGHAEPGARWTVTCQGATMRLIVDCVEVARVTDGAYRTGHIGFWAYLNGQYVAIDDVSIAATVPPCGGDRDRDGIPDERDNCPDTANAGQQNADGDAAGDACDGCPLNAGKTEPGLCGCAYAEGQCAFKRGDANADRRVDVGDAITVLGHLFGGKTPLSCADAADANDDGRLDIADAVRILAHLFAAAGPLPAPFGVCGGDPTSDGTACVSFVPCGP